MELIILGCDGSYPAARGATSGYLLRQGEHLLLLDCGSGVMARLMALADPARLDGIIITHWHNDHACDLLVLRYYLQATRQRQTVFAPLQPDPLKELCVCPEFDLRPLPPSFCCGPFALSTFQTRHPVPAYAVKAVCAGKTLVYTGDTNIVDGLADFAAGADLLLADAAFDDAQWTPDKPHLSASHAGALAAQAGAGQLVITHCPPHQQPDVLLQQAKAAFAKTIAAQNGLRLML